MRCTKVIYQPDHALPATAIEALHDWISPMTEIPYNEVLFDNRSGVVNSRPSSCGSRRFSKERGSSHIKRVVQFAFKSCSRVPCQHTKYHVPHCFHSLQEMSA